jgi:hypothetical protein
MQSYFSKKYFALKKWLVDVFVSWQPQLKAEDFQVWKISVNPDNSALIVCEDGNNNELTRQEIPFTDFPLENFKCYVERSGEYTVALLTSEH